MRSNGPPFVFCFSFSDNVLKKVYFTLYNVFPGFNLRPITLGTAKAQATFVNFDHLRNCTNYNTLIRNEPLTFADIL